MSDLGQIVIAYNRDIIHLPEVYRNKLFYLLDNVATLGVIVKPAILSSATDPNDNTCNVTTFTIRIPEQQFGNGCATLVRETIFETVTMMRDLGVEPALLLVNLNNKISPQGHVLPDTEHFIMVVPKQNAAVCMSKFFDMFFEHIEMGDPADLLIYPEGK